MKRILTLVLCWLLVFEAFAGTTFKAKTAASVAGGYVTSLNKVDGSFEDGTTGWVASVGTITATASTEFQGNFKGVWAGTGTGTLDLQWTATASNTYELSAQVNVKGENDVYVCAYVGITETGCKLIPALDKIQKVSVIAYSVMGSAFYLRLKHTGSDAFSVDVDDGKIEPWTQNVANLVQQESITYAGYASISSNYIKFANKDTLRSRYGELVTDAHSASSTKTRFTVLKRSLVNVSSSVYLGTGTSAEVIIRHFNSLGVLQIDSGLMLSTNFRTAAMPMSIQAEAGDYFEVYSSATPVTQPNCFFSITAQAVSDNIIQSYQDGMATTATLSYAQVNALAGLQGLSFSAGYVGYYRDGQFLKYFGTLTYSGSGVEARLPLPNGLVTSSSIVSPQLFGEGATNNINGNSPRNIKILAAPSVNYITFGTDYYGSTALGALTSVNGNAVTFLGATQFSFNATIPIQGWSSTPTLLALPTSKENVFSAKQNGATGAITTSNSNWITSSAHSSTGITTINFSGLELTAIPMVSATSLASGILTSVTAISTTTATFTSRDYNGSLVDTSISITLQKQSPDYTAPGVFVGNVQPEWQYDLTVTGTNWTTIRAVGVVYKMASGQYRMRFNIEGAASLSSRTTYQITVSGVTFKNAQRQAVIGYPTSGAALYYCLANSNASTIDIGHATSTAAEYNFSGDVELESKPSWAVNTP